MVPGSNKELINALLYKHSLINMLHNTFDTSVITSMINFTVAEFEVLLSVLRSYK